MKIIFTLFLIYSCSFVFSQTYTSSCTATPQIESLYRNDVYKCATTRILAINSTFKDSVEIPAIFRDSIAKVFYAIQNMQPNPLKDTILNIFGFSDYYSFRDYEVDSLHLLLTSNPSSNISVKSVEMYSFSTPIPWASDWIAGNYNNTAYPAVNNLVNKYQLSISGSYNLGVYYFKVTAGYAINPRGLANKFNAILNSTTACTPFRYIGDGNSIYFSYENDGIKITYRNACGPNCPAGCNFGKRWMFKVYFATCNVEYLGYTTESLPPYPLDGIYTCTRGPVVFPVTFSSITGYLQSGKTALNWKVLTQVNVKEYVVERSDNGQQFFTAGTVPANNALTADYTWKDAALLTGTAWYRIKAVDLDGKSKYSSTVKITGASKANSFTVYPNPIISKTFTIQFGTSASGQMNANLYSADGKKVWASTLSLTLQTVSRTLALPPAIQPGIYALVVENNNGSYRQTLVIPD